MVNGTYENDEDRESTYAITGGDVSSSDVSSGELSSSEVSSSEDSSSHYSSECTSRGGGGGGGKGCRLRGAVVELEKRLEVVSRERDEAREVVEGIRRLMRSSAESV